MNCPKCGSDSLRVLDTRERSIDIRRRRECSKGHRFSTLEIFWDRKKPKIERDTAKLKKLLVSLLMELQ